MEWKVSITGDKTLDKAMRELEPKFRRKVAQQAMRKGMKIIHQTARQYVSVGKPQPGKPDHTPGLLKKNVKVRAGKRSRRTFGIDVRVNDKDFVGKTWYGSAVELGTKKQEGQHFLERAYKEKGPTVTKLVEQECWNGIKKILKEGG